jgi:translation initiation factor IF-1
MSKSDVMEFDGIVDTVLPGTKFKVKLILKDKDGNETVQDDKIVDCTISGKLRSNFIKVTKGDRVMIEMSPYDLTRGRISWRYK